MIKGMKAVDFKFHVIDYGPKIRLSNGMELTPQDLIVAASWMTFEEGDPENLALSAIKAIEKTVEKELEERGELKDEKNLEEKIKDGFQKKIKDSLIGSAGRGHASLSTTPGIWGYFKGASKFVDSMFTGAIFSSSLMPSGRRIPVDVNSILAPKSIMNSNNFIKNIYFETSKKNIELYEELLEKKIDKQEAAKITQYGIDGGGLIYLPLETIIGYKHEFDIEGKWIPQEGYDFINQIESQLKDLGMDILYFAREGAPRNTFNYPNIFTDPNKGSLVHSIQRRIMSGINPILQEDFFYRGSGSFENDFKKLEELSKEIRGNPESIKERWKELLLARKDLVKRYNGIISISSFVDVSWRVWGELKRHRTLEQSVESVYHAIDRARDVLNNYKEPISKGYITDRILDDISKVFIIPPSIYEDKELRKKWILRFASSINAYNMLINGGRPESDAIGVVPRGLKLSTFKRYDLYNILDGYLPLRTCGTAEPEMKKITEAEENKIKYSLRDLSKLIGPKCSAVGFCLEPFSSYKKCGKINKFVGFKYNERFHKEMDGIRKQLIYDKI